MNFINETDEVIGGYNEGSDQDSTSPPASQRTAFPVPSNQPPQSDSPMTAPFGNMVLPPLHSITSFAHSGPVLPPLPKSNPTFARFNSLPEEDPQLPSPAASIPRAHSASDVQTSTGTNVSLSRDGSLLAHASPTIYLETPVWPLKDPAEALLLRHFVQKLAIWVLIIFTSISLFLY